ncbi:MAG: hypothetical protein U0822_14835 [Anaerolineae bacterium]
MPDVTLDRLWQLACKVGDKSGVEPELVFQPIGLLLHHPLTARDYTSTPLNSSTFASTGGDGVHYGLLHTIGDVSDASPVVMTVPMAFERPNLIVGDSLLEFLCLGCQVGYAYLEHLAYNRHEATDWIGNAQNWFNEKHYGPLDLRAQSLLEILVREFDLKPWPEVGRRVDELQERFLLLLETQTAGK